MSTKSKLLASFGMLSCLSMFSNSSVVHAQVPCGYSPWVPTGEIFMQGFNPDWDITEADSIYLTVNVPEDAVVQVNGDPTAMVGATRYFVIRHLDPARSYKFEISAVTLNAADIELEEKTSVVLAAGSRHSVTLKPYKRRIVDKEQDGEDDSQQDDTPNLPDETSS